MKRAGFTLVEAVIAIVVLSIAVPATMAMIRDATVARADSTLTSRALWLGSAVSEQILADAASDDPELGMEGFENQSAYLQSGTSGLYDRLEPVAADYAHHGILYEVSIGPLVSEDGTASGDPALDIYRQIGVEVLWTNASGDNKTMPLSFLVTDLTP